MATALRNDPDEPEENEQELPLAAQDINRIPLWQVPLLVNQLRERKKHGMLTEAQAKILAQAEALLWEAGE